MYFLKRNWKNLIVFALCVVGIVLWICTIRIGSVEETKRISKSVAGMETPMPAVLDTDDPGGVSGCAVSGSGVSEVTVTSEPESDTKNDKQKDNKQKDKGSKETPEKKNNKDKYETDPVPTGKPKPVNEEDQNIKKDWFYVYLSIDCKTILDHMDDLNEGLDRYVGDGVILKKTKVKCYDGESVWDVLLRECKARGINLESKYVETFGTEYIEAINNIGEFDCGELSGWRYSVNDWYPNYGASRYVLKKTDVIKWSYTCDLGAVDD